MGKHHPDLAYDLVRQSNHSDAVFLQRISRSIHFECSFRRIMSALGSESTFPGDMSSGSALSAAPLQSVTR